MTRLTYVMPLRQQTLRLTHCSNSTRLPTETLISSQLTGYRNNASPIFKLQEVAIKYVVDLTMFDIYELST